MCSGEMDITLDEILCILYFPITIKLLNYSYLEIWSVRFNGDIFMSRSERSQKWDFVDTKETRARFSFL